MVRALSFFVVISIFALGEVYAGKGKNNKEVYIDDIKNNPPKKKANKKLGNNKGKIFYDDNIENTPPKKNTLKKTEKKNKLKGNVDGVLISPLKLRVQNISPSSLLEKSKGREKRGKTLYNDLENFSSSKVSNQKVPIFPFLLTASPTTAELKYFSPVRRSLALAGYKEGIQKKVPISSPEVRGILKNNDQRNYWTQNVCFKEKYVCQADFLFDPDAEVMDHNGIWETNLERMHQGHCPIGHKGITHKKERKTLPIEEIQSQQKRYRIELHHLTQKDTCTHKDPICEITHVAHMGKNARLIIKPSPGADGIIIVHSSQDKENATRLCKSGEAIKTNLLHFQTGSTHIERAGDFDPWRKAYWKNRAKEIEKGNFVGKEILPPLVTPMGVFTSPVKLGPNCNPKPKVKKKLSFSSPINSPLKEKQL